MSSGERIKNRSQQEWFTLLEECYNSGKIMGIWCKEHDINTSSFIMARTKIKEALGAGASVIEWLNRDERLLNLRIEDWKILYDKVQKSYNFATMLIDEGITIKTYNNAMNVLYEQNIITKPKELQHLTFAQLRWYDIIKEAEASGESSYN